MKNWKTVHTLMAVAAALATSLPSAGHYFAPSWQPAFLAAGGACALVAVVLGAVSDSVVPS